MLTVSPSRRRSPASAPGGTVGKAVGAGERVVEYLLREFDRPERKEKSRLPTNKELARHLNVSLGTVQAALRRLAEEGRIHSRRGSGTYLLPRKRRGVVRIGISSPLERLRDWDGWISRIGGGMFGAALQRGATIEGVSRHDGPCEATIDELLAKMDRLDALILYPYTVAPHHRLLMERFEAAGKPVICIQPPEVSATANFVTTDFFGAAFALGKAWQHTGRRSIASLCNGGSTKAMVASHQMRHLGLVSGIGSALGVSVTLRSIFSDSNAEEAGYRAMRELLGSGPTPDAVFCSGDWLALGAFRALSEAGHAVPEAVSIVGASGMDLTHTACPDLTRVSNHLERVGEEAIAMIFHRLSLDGLPVPGVVLPTAFLGGATTRPEENRLLQLHPGSPEPHP